MRSAGLRKVRPRPILLRDHGHGQGPVDAKGRVVVAHPAGRGGRVERGNQIACLGVVGQLLGLASGFALALILIYVVNVQSFGWTIQLHVPLAFLVQSSLLVIVSTAIAGFYPARFAAGFRPVDEVAVE